MRISTALRSVSRLALPAFVAMSLPAAAVPSRSVSPAPARPLAPAPVLSPALLDESFGRLPLQFEVNRGQVDPRVRYLTRGRGSTLFLTDDEAVWVLSSEERSDPPAKPKDPLDARARRREPGKRISSVVRMRLEGSKAKPRLDGLDRLPGNVNYFIGNDPKKWRTDVPTFRKVRVEDVYEGIDLVYYGNQRQVEYDFVVKPGVDPSVIRVAFTGADRISTDSSGDLVVATRAGDLRMKSPLVYQERDGQRALVAAAYVVLPGEKKVEFRLAEYDRDEELVIDPVIVWSTFVGGGASVGADDGAAIAVGSDGNPVVVGDTWSDDFPTTPGAFQTTGPSGDPDAFIFKLNADGTNFIFSTVLGTPGWVEAATAVAVSGTDIYVTGTGGWSPQFPITPGAYHYPGGYLFAVKLSPMGNALNYSAVLPGTYSYGIAANQSGSAFITGSVYSPPFPTTPGAIQDDSYISDYVTGWAASLSSDGSALLYSTILGGRTTLGGGTSAMTEGRAIAVDATGRAWVTGVTDAVDFPTTPGAFQPALANGSRDVFVIGLNPEGTGTIFSTLLGGSETDTGDSIALGPDGSVFVGGNSYSGSSFPRTAGAYNGLCFGRGATLTRIAPGGGSLLYSLQFCLGNSNSQLDSVIVDGLGRATISGFASGSHFPVSPGSPIPVLDNFTRRFVARFNPTGSDYEYSGAYGPPIDSAESVVAIAPASNGDVFVAGDVMDSAFPTTSGTIQPAFAGGVTDAFVVRMHLPLPVSVASISPATGPSLGGTAVTITGSGFQAGALVRIGGIPAVVSSVTPTSISAVTGPHPDGLVDVEIENPDGGVAVLNDAFTYVCGGSAPTATVSGGGTVCSGESVTLSVALTGSGPWNLVWSDDFAQNGIVASPATRDVTPVTTTTYTVRSVTDTACAGTASGSATVTVNPVPVASLTVPVRVCSGASANAAVAQAAGATYAWSITNGSILSGQGSNAITFSAASNPVTVSVVVSLGSCTDTDSRAIPVSLPPSATVSGGGTVCAGEVATVSFDLTGAPPFTVRWSDGVVQAVGAAGPGSRSVTPATSTTYTITSLTDANGCAGGVASGSAPVTVNPVPSAAITAPGSYCAGASSLGASVPDAGAGATYAWTIAGGAIAGSTTAPSVTFTPTGASVTLGVTVTLPSGCASSSSRASTLAPAPTAVVSGGGTVCAGNAATLQATLTGMPPFTLTWSDGFVQSGIGSTVATRSVRPAASRTYTVTAVQDASCSGSASGSADVTVTEAPSALVSTPSSIICLGASATITVQLSGPGPYTLTWGDGLVETVTGPTSVRTVSPFVTETFLISSVSNGTCTSPGIGSSQVIVFPDASAATITGPGEVCARSSGHTATVPDAGDGTTWEWTVSNGTIDSGQGTRSVRFSAGDAGDTTLSVTVRAAGGCEVSGSLRVRANARPPLPVITAPASLESGETGVVAEIPGAAGLTCTWTISNGAIISGEGTSRITFSAGDPGLVVLDVVARNAKGCDSAAGHLEIPVRGLSAVRLAPIVLDVAGPGGKRYATELALANPSPSLVKVDLFYTPAASLGATGGGTVSEILEAGRQRIIPDVLAWLRAKGLAIPSDGSPQGGTLRVTFDNIAAGWSPSATTRTTVAAGAGRAGLSMPALNPDSATAPKVWLFGLRENAADRSHVALANVGTEGSIDLRVTLHPGEGSSVPKHVLPMVHLEAGQWLQLNSVLREAGFGAGYALVERVAGNAPFHAYAVFNDNATNDGSVVPATPAAKLGGPRLVPVVVETGAFTSELVLANPSARAVKARLWFIESLANPGGYSLGGVTVDLAAGEQKILPGIVAGMRKLGLVVTPPNREYAGTLAVTFSAAGEPADGWAGARTATAGDGPGRYGLFCTASTPDGAPDEAWLFGLIQDAGARSNLALVNAAANLGPVTLRYSVFDGASGRKVATSDSVTLGAGAWMQLNGVLSKWKVAQGYVRVERVEGNAPFLAYAVVNDGGMPGAGTGDGSFVEMAPMVR